MCPGVERGWMRGIEGEAVGIIEDWARRRDENAKRSKRFVVEVELTVVCG